MTSSWTTREPMPHCSNEISLLEIGSLHRCHGPSNHFHQYWPSINISDSKRTASLALWDAGIDWKSMHPVIYFSRWTPPVVIILNWSDMQNIRCFFSVECNVLRFPLQCKASLFRYIASHDKDYTALRTTCPYNWNSHPSTLVGRHIYTEMASRCVGFAKYSTRIRYLLFMLPARQGIC